MTPKELKYSIVKLALEGKLVKRSEESGIDYYDSIVQFKKESKISPKKHLDVENDSFPFDIPDNWKWCRFGEIVDYRMGKTPPRAESEWWKDDVPWISIADMVESGYVLTTKEKVSNSAIANKFGGLVSPRGTLIMSFKLTVGRVSILDIDAVHNEAIISIFPFLDESNILRDYLFYTLPFLSQYGDTKGAIKGNTLNDISLCNLPVPLPSLEEQKRIVAKIEELLPLIDRYEEAWSELEKFNSKFPVDMENSILQFAIKGKLVEQRSEEGSGSELYKEITLEKQLLTKQGFVKKEKSFPPIEDDELPFDIPSSWVWVRLNNVCYRIFAGGDKPTDFVPTKDDKHPVPVVANGVTNDGILGYTSSPTANKNSITVAGRGTIGFSVYREYDYCPIVRLIVLEQSKLINPKYLLHVLNGLLETGQGTSIPQLTVPMIAPKVIPLPPLKEQERIVGKLEELLPLCRKLIK